MTNIPAFVVAPDEGLKYQIILIRVTQDEILLKCPVLTSSSRLLCSFCCSIRFCLSASSWRLYSSCSRSCCSWRSCWRRSASERSLFSCCSRMKSRRRVDSPGTLTMELHGGTDVISEFTCSGDRFYQSCVLACYLGSPSCSDASSSSSSLPLYSYSVSSG